MSTELLLAVGSGAAAGAVVRYAAEVVHARWRVRRGLVSPGGHLPVATLAVNVLGSAILGLVAGLAVRGDLGPVAAAGLGAGLAGGLTTFSTFAFDVVTLIRLGERRTAVSYVAATVVLGVGAAALTYHLLAGAAASA